MRHTDAIVIGAGQAGLAMSNCLGRQSIDHVVLERGQVAERWRNERWDSLRLLTPNWMSRLPGWSYQGSDPDGFMTAAEVAGYLQHYANDSTAPVICGAAVQSVWRVPGGYRIESERGGWQASCVVIATGHCDTPVVPDIARDVPASIHQLTPTAYRNPNQLPQGGVLVVGASASGLQLAEEIQQSGRQVTLSVSRHTRLPRMYRGRDIMWWLDRPGILQSDATPAELHAASVLPSMQLVGRPERCNLDLGVLRKLGVRLVGRTAAIRDGVAYLNNNLAAAVTASQTRLVNLLRRVDVIADAIGMPDEPWPAGLSFDRSPASLDFAANDIRTVIWATGFKQNYRWLKVPVLDASGAIIHAGGVTPSPGLYVTGLRFLRRKDASLIAAVTADATELAAEIRQYLHRQPSAAA